MIKRVKPATWAKKKAKGLCYVPYCRTNSFTNPQTGEDMDICLRHYIDDDELDKFLEEL